MADTPDAGMVTYPKPGIIDLDLYHYGFTWEHFWDEQTQTFTPDSTRNIHLLFVRALVAGQVPAQFALRFGKDMAFHIHQRPGDGPKEICGMAKSWLGQKLACGNRRTLSKKKTNLLDGFEFAAVGCCCIQFAEPAGSTSSVKGTHKVGSRRSITMVDAETQTDFNYEDMMAWVQSMAEQQQRAGGQSPLDMAVADVEGDAPEDLQLVRRLQNMKNEAPTKMCGAPVIIGRMRNESKMRCHFIGHCQHGQGASCGYIHSVVRDELVRLIKEKVGPDLTTGDLWLELQQFLTDMAQSNPVPAADMKRLMASQSMMVRAVRKAKRTRRANNDILLTYETLTPEASTIQVPSSQEGSPPHDEHLHVDDMLPAVWHNVEINQQMQPHHQQQQQPEQHRAQHQHQHQHQQQEDHGHHNRHNQQEQLQQGQHYHHDHQSFHVGHPHHHNHHHPGAVPFQPDHQYHEGLDVPHEYLKAVFAAHQQQQQQVQSVPVPLQARIPFMQHHWPLPHMPTSHAQMNSKQVHGVNKEARRVSLDLQ